MTAKPPAPQVPTLEPNVVTNNSQLLLKQYWEIVRSIKAQVAEQDFGAAKGKGGSDLKNSHQLFHFLRPIMAQHKLDVDIEPIDVTGQVVGSTLMVSGMYNTKWFIDGVLAYETQTFGAFDTNNSAQATHGSATAAKTALYFNIFFASVKSDDDMDADRQQQLNRQVNRKPAEARSGVNINSDEVPY